MKHTAPTDSKILTNDDLANIYGKTWKEGYNYLLDVNQAGDVQYTVRHLYAQIDLVKEFLDEGAGTRKYELYKEVMKELNLKIDIGE